jgi:hypothetical protein
MADLSPIMTLFAKWNKLRDHSDERGLDDDEVDRRCDETDKVMDEILALPPTDATDVAAKLMCFTHYGNYSLEEFAGGAGFMQEMAALVGHPEALEYRFRRVAEGGAE